jgi:prefoldin subunit 5
MRLDVFIVVIFLFSLTFMFSTDAVAQGRSETQGKACRYCPPPYCEDAAVARQLKEEKKAEARLRGLPERLLKYFDDLPDCPGCITSAPDWITLGYSIDREEYKKKQGWDPGFDRRWMPWSRDMEQRLRDEMRQGLVKEIHFIHYTGICECCPDESWESYQNWHEQVGTIPDGMDYDDEFEYDPNHGDGITNPGELGPDPKDLTEIPEGQKRSNAPALPPTNYFTDPGVRIVHVMCPACKGLGDQYNALGRQVEALRQPIAKARRELHLLREVLDDVGAEIAATGDLARTPETIKQREKLDEEYSTRQQQIAQKKEKLQRMMNERAALQAQMSALLDKIKECEKNCHPEESLEDGNNTVAPPPADEHLKTGSDAVKEEPKKEALAVASADKKKSGGKCAVPKAKSIKIGPNGEYGTGAQMKDKAKNMAKGAALGALGNALGGSGISLGGGSVGAPGGGGGGAKGPKTEKDPVGGEFIRIASNGVDLGIKAGFVKGGLAVSQKIFDSPGGNSTFHTMWIADGAGRIQAPARYFIIGLYVDHKLTVWWTYDHWTNGVHDAHSEGSETTAWRTQEGSFIRRFEGADGIENSMWYQSGFDTAVKGVKHMGATFNVTPDELAGPCPLNLVTHVTMPGQEPDIGTTPFVSQIFIDPAESDGKSIADLNVQIVPAD